VRGAGCQVGEGEGKAGFDGDSCNSSLHCPAIGNFFLRGVLERFKKYCSHSVEIREKRSFWVLASFRLSYRVFKPAPSPKPRQNPKILAPNGHTFFKTLYAFARDLRSFGVGCLTKIEAKQKVGCGVLSGGLYIEVDGK